MEKLKLTIIDMQPIDPPVGGGRIRLFGLYGALPENIQATYVGTYDWRGPGPRDHQLVPCLREIDVPLSEKHFKAHDKLSAKIGKGCIDVAFPTQGKLSRDFVSRVHEEIKNADVVIISHPWVFPVAISAVDIKRQLLVYDSHNMEALLRTKLLDDGAKATDKLLREAARTEYELCHAADLILACSEEDKDNFARFFYVPPDKMSIVPNGVFNEKIRPCLDASHKNESRKKLGLKKPTACFIGSPYTPNEEAARLIVKTADRLKEWQFVIIGGVSQNLQDIDQTKHGNVTITGFVDEDEKAEYLAACDIAVNPMLSGSGTNIKMFEFMAAGLPIITTEIGARGIHNTSGNLYLLCKPNPTDLIEKMLELQNDRELYETLRENALIEANGKYSWGGISKRLGALLTQEYNRKMHPKSRILMVSSYPPDRCGIGAYAYQQVQFLRQEGHHVDVLALRGNGKYRSALKSPKELALLDKLAPQYDKVIMQYCPDFYNMDFGTPAKTTGKLRDVADSWNKHKNIEVVCHEIDYTDTRESVKAQMLRAKWNGANSLVFHTQLEVEQFCEKLSIPFDESKIRVVAPNSYYVKFRDISQHEAREELGIPLDKEVFLCIGFIQPSKAYDRAAEAFAQLQEHEKESKALYIVGSVRFVCEETINYLERLKQYGRDHEHIHLHEKYVSDEAFDTWISASDYVIVPYQEIWSSAVLERAGLFNKKCIVRDVGGMKEQLKEGDILFEDYADLERIIAGANIIRPKG